MKRLFLSQIFDQIILYSNHQISVEVTIYRALDEILNYKQVGWTQGKIRKMGFDKQHKPDFTSADYCNILFMAFL